MENYFSEAVVLSTAWLSTDYHLVVSIIVVNNIYVLSFLFGLYIVSRNYNKWKEIIEKIKINKYHNMRFIKWTSPDTKRTNLIKIEYRLDEFYYGI